MKDGEGEEGGKGREAINSNGKERGGWKPLMMKWECRKRRLQVINNEMERRKTKVLANFKKLAEFLKIQMDGRMAILHN